MSADTPVISDFAGTVVRVTAGESTSIAVNIDSNPDTVNTIEPVSTTGVPPSITTLGNSLIIFNASRRDSGEYDFVATNGPGSDRARFTLNVECEFSNTLYT